MNNVVTYIIVGLVLIGVCILSILNFNQRKPMDDNELFFISEVINVDAGQEFTVDIWVDTHGIPVDGLDVFLPLQGVTLVDFKDYPISGSNSFDMMYQDVLNGTLRFIFVATPLGKQFTGKGILATLTLKATEDTVLNFDYTPGSTIDSNMSVAGVDILTDMNSLQIIINKGDSMNASLLASLQTLANEHKVRLSGTATPVPQPAESFEVTPN